MKEDLCITFVNISQMKSDIKIINFISIVFRNISQLKYNKEIINFLIKISSNTEKIEKKLLFC